MLGGRHSGVIVWREMHLSNARQHDLCVAVSRFLRDSKNSRVIRPIGAGEMSALGRQIAGSPTRPSLTVPTLHFWLFKVSTDRRTTANRTNKRKIFVVIREISSNFTVRRRKLPINHRSRPKALPTDLRSGQVWLRADWQSNLSLRSRKNSRKKMKSTHQSLCSTDACTYLGSNFNKIQLKTSWPYLQIT